MFPAPHRGLCSLFQAENKGKPLLDHEVAPVNVPAIAAAHAIKRYVAQAADELSFEVGDIVCVIDMPPKELTPWWRGKLGFQVGTSFRLESATSVKAGISA
ncbi:rho GTPase-activating protein 32-like [Phasianus colchicus]|uniref:rho GTPase-activating protein 32-like n=1 Tax=Phasianus colchicus TaxID=9054 RepID=UPI00129E708E|nr:rho GTPase-activating protein 32-like [Phasianus colchicus]